MGLSGNKGEWSELYVLFKLLADKRIYAGDGDLNKLEIFYPVLQIIRDELKRHLEYDAMDDIIVITEDGSVVSRVEVEHFLEQSNLLFSSIQNSPKGKGAFEIPAVEDFLKKIHCERIKAKSSDKSDIKIVIHDFHTGFEPTLGFSIKSNAGSSPTLLNASAPTTFVYEIEHPCFNDEMMDSINAISGSRKVQDRVNAIYAVGGLLRFKQVPNSIFCSNMRMMDSFLPEIIAWMLANSYLCRKMDICSAIESITTANPLHFNLSDGHDYYGFKLKSFMTAIALGMKPASMWSGRYESTGGYIVVKENGDVICFHIYDRNLLEDYLLYNTKFETPKSERYNFAHIYKDGDKYLFNLVLQIRFK